MSQFSIFCRKAAHTKTQQITDKASEHNGRKLFSRVSIGGVNFICYPLSYINWITHYLHQLSLSPCFYGQDTDTITATMITCIFHQVEHHRCFCCCRRQKSRIRYYGHSHFICLPLLGQRRKQSRCLEPTVAVTPGVGHRRKFLITPSIHLFPTSHLSHIYP